MADIPRLNGAIKALESGKPAFVPFTSGEISNALTISGAPYDGVVFEMEHNPYDIKALRDCLQYMLNRRQIADVGLDRAGGDAVRAHPAERRREQPVDRQAGAGHRRLWHRMAARIHGRGRAQRGAGLPLSAPARGEILRSARPARRRAAPRPRATGG